MRFLELLRIFRTIADLPDFSDKQATQKWLLELCSIGKLLTDRTPTPADDAVLAFLERSIGNPALFDPIYDLLTALLAGAGESQKVGLTPALAGEAEKAGIDPLTILAIVEAVASLIKLIRERRGAK
jgi:uncharacterized membrane protein affecting hemolysin expression